MAAQAHFQHHDRNAQHQNENKIGDQEGEPSVAAHQIREFPQIAQADGGSGGGQNKAQTAGPLIAAVFVFHSVSSQQKNVRKNR